MVKEKLFNELYENKVVCDFEALYADFIAFCESKELVSMAQQFNVVANYVSESLEFGMIKSA